MDRKKKKRRHTSEHKGVDRISTLPDDLIHLILKRLHCTRRAIQTCVLSKRWKLIWTTLPFLEFECPLRLPSKSFTNIARHVLKHRNHLSSISRLELAYLPPGLTDKFIDYAVSHRVQDLYVYFRREQKAFKFSRFSCESIRKLEVRMKVEEADCWDLPALTDLHLWLLPTGDGKNVLPVRCLTCLPALRNLSLTLWDFQEPAVYLSLPELTTLHLALCKMPPNIWNLPALKTLTLHSVRFPGNMSDMFAALVSLQNLTLRMMSMQDCYIPCPQLINLEIETHFNDTIEDNIVVLAPKLRNFTAVGIFPITFKDSKLDNVYINVRGWIYRSNVSKKTMKEYYKQFVIMLPGLGSAKILHLQLETIEALSSISDFLVSFPSPFYNLKYVKLPHGFEEASLSSIVRSYLLGGSPIASIVATLPQDDIKELMRQGKDPDVLISTGKSHGPDWMVGRHGKGVGLASPPGPITEPYVEELIKKIGRNLENKLEDMMNRKFKEKMSWLLKKLGEANPDMKFDIGDFSGTTSSDQDDNGTPPITQGGTPITQDGAS